MRTRIRGFLVVGSTLALLLGLWPATTRAVVLDENVEDGYVEYLGVTGVLEERNAPYRLLVPTPPQRWNGTLMVYARGTGSLARLNESGEPMFDENGFPRLGVTPLINVPGTPPGDNGPDQNLEQALLRQGYALVASDYRPDQRFIDYGLLGWVVEDGIRDTQDVTKEARGILESLRGPPAETLLWARSQGSMVALKIIEEPEDAQYYDGVISGCTVGAGAPRSWDVGLGFALAYDVTFGWIWGSPEGGDLPPLLSFEEDVALKLLTELSQPGSFAKFEFIRLVTGIAFERFYPSPEDPFSWLFADMLFLTEVRADVESEFKANGRVAQNVGHSYSLTEAEKMYLAALGLINVDELLDEMNARTDIVADPGAREYVENFADFSGDIQKRVLSMHTVKDGLVIPAQESAYRETVTAAGHADELVQVYTDSVGHCTFTPNQWLATIRAMKVWLNTGIAPRASFFPKGLGFVKDFEPPPWPQP